MSKCPKSREEEIIQDEDNIKTEELQQPNPGQSCSSVKDPRLGSEKLELVRTRIFWFPRKPTPFLIHPFFFLNGN